jgi:hypothetical protein
MNEVQKLMVLNGLLSIFLQKVREFGTVQFFIYETRRGLQVCQRKQSELQSQVLTVVGLNYCNVPRVSAIQYYSATGQFIHVFS